MTALVEEIKKLKKQVDAADKRINKAWDDWDAEAYEGACETRERFYAKLQNLRRKTVKPLAQPRIVLAPVRLPWHRRINWWYVDTILFGIVVWLFVIWCAAKGVR